MSFRGQISHQPFPGNPQEKRPADLKWGLAASSWTSLLVDCRFLARPQTHCFACIDEVLHHGIVTPARGDVQRRAPVWIRLVLVGLGLGDSRSDWSLAEDRVSVFDGTHVLQKGIVSKGTKRETTQLGFPLDEPTTLGQNSGHELLQGNDYLGTPQSSSRSWNRPQANHTDAQTSPANEA